MPILIWIIIVVLVVYLLALNLWGNRFRKAEKIRRASLTPQERDEEDFDDWWNRHW